MSTPTLHRLQEALAADLKRLGADGVVNDAVRKTFSTHVHGATIEFGHNQSDPAYWSGVKHYGSGPRSKFRMRRTPVAPVAVAKKPSTRSKTPAATATPHEK